MPQPRRSILILEDNFIIGWDLHDLLEEAGFSVLEPVADNARALETIARENPGFALLDYDLGAQTSVQTARVLADKRIPFAYLSGAPETIARDPDAPRGPILAKPATPAQIIAVACACQGAARASSLA